MKLVLFIVYLVILSFQLTAQTWVKNGDDFIADTTYFNSLSDICIDGMPERVVISLKNLNLQTGQEEIITQAYNRTNGTLTECSKYSASGPRKHNISLP